MAYGGLVGFGLQVISPDGHVQYRRIIANTATTLTLDKPWDTVPVVTDPLHPELNFAYRVPAYPEDQTDGVVRGPRVAWSINNEIGGTDTINAGGGTDVVVGGAGQDTLRGGSGGDFLAGDNARFDFKPLVGLDGATSLALMQTVASTVGDIDTVAGGGGSDVVFGGAAGDFLYGDDVIGRSLRRPTETMFCWETTAGSSSTPMRTSPPSISSRRWIRRSAAST